MERLTERHEYNGKNHISVDREKNGITCSNYCTSCGKADCDDIRAALFKLAEYEDFEEIFREKMTETACDFLSDKEEFGKWLDRNKWITRKCDEWVRAEEHGLILRLPCKVGDTVYTLQVDEEKFEHFHCGVKIEKIDFDFWMIPIFGKTIFLTQAEAEEALRKMKEIEEKAYE